MEDKKTIATETAENTSSKEYNGKTAPGMLDYDPDDYLKQYCLHDGIFYYTEKCFSCKHWITYNCIDPINSCKYEPIEILN